MKTVSTKTNEMYFIYWFYYTCEAYNICLDFPQIVARPLTPETRYTSLFDQLEKT